MKAEFEIQGHRGARGEVPENTIPSMEAALDSCVDSIETDLHLTSDGIVILAHDPVISPKIFSIGPTSSGVKTGSLIRSLSLSQLRQFPANGNPDKERFPEQSTLPGPASILFASEMGMNPFAVPTLEDVILFLKAYAGDTGIKAGKTELQRKKASRVILDLEIKRVPFYPETIGDSFTEGNSEILEEKIVREVRRHDLIGRTVVRSFDHRSVREVKRMEPGLTVAVLIADTIPEDPVSMALAAGATIYCPSFSFVDKKLVNTLHKAGIRIIPWTANDEKTWQQLLELDVDGITTDYPAKFSKWIRNQA